MLGLGKDAFRMISLLKGEFDARIVYRELPLWAIFRGANLIVLLNM